MTLTLTIIHVIIAVVLVVTVLMQHGKQQGLSGAIAGGAETFFGKNKGRTIDAMLKKFTAVVAILFVISSLALTALAVKDSKSAPVEETAQQETASEDIQTQYMLDEEGNMVDAEGNIIATAEEVAEAQAQAQAAEAQNGETAEEVAEETAEQASDEAAEAPADDAE